MGMFDYIRSEYPLPSGAPFSVNSTTEMQTKDLDSAMDSYIIGADGRLRREERKWVDDPNYVKRTEDELNALPSIIDRLAAISSGWMERTGNLVEYTDDHGHTIHGVIVMYAWKDNSFADYRVVFTHGVVEEIEFVESRIP